MVIFYSYVSLPEGNLSSRCKILRFYHFLPADVDKIPGSLTPQYQVVFPPTVGVHPGG